MFFILHMVNLLYKCPVAKLGSKAGNFLSGKRGGGALGRERREPLQIFNLNVWQQDLN